MKRGVFILLVVFAMLFFFNSVSLTLAQDEQTKVIMAYNWLYSKTVEKEWKNIPPEELVWAWLAQKDVLAENERQAGLEKLINLSGGNPCWPFPYCDAKTTALAKLALNKVKATQNVDEWLLNKTKFYSINWSLQITSAENEALVCQLEYDSGAYLFNVTEKDELVSSGNFGHCFEVSSDKYRLSLKEECINKSFNFTCLQKFRADWLFQSDSIWYVPGEGVESQGVGNFEKLQTEVPFKPLCVVNDFGCDYEATAWTAYSFFEADQNQKAQLFLPYLVLEKEKNKQFLPEAFLYALAGVDEISALQRVDNYLWLAPGSAHNEVYDTALVALMTTRQAGNFTKAKEKLFTNSLQGGPYRTEGTTKGFWYAKEGNLTDRKPLRDTALVLYALQAKPTPKENGESCSVNDECESGCCSNNICNETGYCEEGGTDDEGENETGQSCDSNNDCISLCCKSNACVAAEECGIKKSCENQGWCLSEVTCKSLGGTIVDLPCPENKICCKTEMPCEGMQGNCKSSCEANEAEIPAYNCSAGKCCKAYSAATCKEVKGNICSAGQKCVKNGYVVSMIMTSDTAYCCLGTCTTPTQNCSQLGGVICDPTENKICMTGKWLASTDDLCCEANACQSGTATCSGLNGEICGTNEQCKDGVLVRTTDTENCCVQGGKCILATCPGQKCRANEQCKGGTLTEAADWTRCCVDGSCIKKCEDLGGVRCYEDSHKCKEKLQAYEDECCAEGKCVERKAFKGFGKASLIWILILLLAACLGLVLWLRKKKGARPSKIKMPLVVQPSRPLLRLAPRPAPRPAPKPAPLKPEAVKKPVEKRAEKREKTLEELEKIAKG